VDSLDYNAYMPAPVIDFRRDMSKVWHWHPTATSRRKHQRSQVIVFYAGIRIAPGIVAA
jgi:hypothetical protein